MNLASIILAVILLTLFATSILLLFILTERNRLQRTLIVILSLFSTLILAGLINMICLHDNGESVLATPLNFRYLFVGLINFFAIMSYYIVAAHHNLFTTKNGILSLSPVLVILGIYIIWHLYAGVPMNYSYASLGEIWENRYTIPVILRVLLYLFFLLYQGVMIIDMWRLDSLRSKYSALNIPDAVSNIRWLRMVVVGIMAVMVVYSLMVFAPTSTTFFIFIIVTASTYLYFVYNAIARRMYKDTDEWQVTWSVRDGWKALEEQQYSQNEELKIVEDIRKVDDNILTTTKKTNDIQSIKIDTNIDYLTRIDEWMVKEKPYCHPGFSASEIINNFEEIDRVTLTKLLNDRGENIQSYIRRFRIEEACSQIRSKKIVKVSELALFVGFSHHTSFSRAFVTVTGRTAVQYMNDITEKE